MPSYLLSKTFPVAIGLVGTEKTLSSTLKCRNLVITFMHLLASFKLFVFAHFCTAVKGWNFMGTGTKSEPKIQNVINRALGFVILTMILSF